MAEINEEWGKCIAELLGRHNLTTRAAERLTGGRVSNTYIHDMRNGKVPELGKAYDFLRVFPINEAIVCLQAAGFPVPSSWHTHSRHLTDAVDLALRNADDIPEEGKVQVREFVAMIHKRYCPEAQKEEPEEPVDNGEEKPKGE